MTGLWKPPTRPAPSIVDSPVDALLRQRHVDRLLALADEYDDHAYQVASTMGFKRARYEEYWAERTRDEASRVAMEPVRKALAAIGVSA